MLVDQLYIDISPIISEETAVFPGDTAFSRQVHMDMSQGDHLGLSSIQCTVHIGAHADAPSHYGKEGASIERISLSPYMGKAQVIQVSKKSGERIYPEDIESVKIKAPRVLLVTQSFPDPNSWNEDFNSLSPELVEYLHAKGVQLIGIDTPSVDPAKSKELESHQMLLKKDIRVLEGLHMRAVDEGLYQLIALPLSIQGSDASPVRAILLPLNVDLSQH